MFGHLNRLKKITSIQPFNLTVRKKIISVQPFNLTVRKKIGSFQRSTDPFRAACLAISYPFACRVFSHSNGYRKERLRMRGHISYNVDRCYDFTCRFCFQNRQTWLFWIVYNNYRTKALLNSFALYLSVIRASKK